MRKLVRVFLIFIISAFLGLSLSGCDTEEKNVEFEYEVVSVELDAGNDFLVDGEILLPKTDNKVPAVVIVPGSGPMDMDGTVNSQKVYESLGIQLAKKGIASIRFNKVTYQHGNNIAKDYSFTLEDEYISTIESSINILKEKEEIDISKIYLIGHSLGAQVIPVVLYNDSTLAGGILMAGTTMHILDLMLEQLKKQDDENYDDYVPYVTYAKSLTEVQKGEEQFFYFGAYTEYYVNYNALNRELVKDLDCELLILQGELDFQVTIEHFDGYKKLLKGRENVEFISYEKLNHLFSDGEGETFFNAYKSKKSVSDKVIE